jgi:hypothetical protein
MEITTANTTWDLMVLVIEKLLYSGNGQVAWGCALRLECFWNPASVCILSTERAVSTFSQRKGATLWIPGAAPIVSYLINDRKYKTESLICESSSLSLNGCILPMPFLVASIISAKVNFFTAGSSTGLTFNALPRIVWANPFAP